MEKRALYSAIHRNGMAVPKGCRPNINTSIVGSHHLLLLIIIVFCWFIIILYFTISATCGSDMLQKSFKCPWVNHAQLAQIQQSGFITSLIVGFMVDIHLVGWINTSQPISASLACGLPMLTRYGSWNIWFTRGITHHSSEYSAYVSNMFKVYCLR